MRENVKQTLHKALALWTAVAIGGLALGWPAGSWASHRWGCLKYADRFINWYNGGTGDYYNIYNEEARTDSNSWHNYTVMQLNSVSSSGTTDHINAYNGFYGFNGWLGLAVATYSGCTVFEGTAMLNQTYLDIPFIYNRTNREHVACQEVGHLFGLAHNTSSTATCMNDTILTAPQPDSHDRDLLASVYLAPCTEPAPYSHVIPHGSDTHSCHAPSGYQYATCNNGSWTSLRGSCAASCTEPAPYSHVIAHGYDSHFCHAPAGYQRATCNNGSWTNYRGLCPE